MLGPVALFAQSPLEEQQPRVEEIVFRGAENVPEADLRSSIETLETRCRSIILQPFCWFSDSRLFVRREYLVREEVVRDVVRLRVAYFRMGYRQAAVSSRVEALDEGVRVVFSVDEGEPTILDRIDIEQTEEVLTSRQIRRTRPPREGEPLNLSVYEEALEQMRLMLAEQGFLNAVIDDTVIVSRNEQTAAVEILMEPGRRATVDSFDIRGNDQVADQTIIRALRVDPGDVLGAEDLIAGQRSLYESNLFHEARVSVPEQADSAKQVVISVREAPQRSARVGVGFNTIQFFQIEGRFTHYNFLGGGRRLTLRGTLGNLLAGTLNDRFIFSDVLPGDDAGLGVDDERPFVQPTWRASIDFRQPAFRRAENVLGLNVFSNRRTVPAVVVDLSYGAEISLTRRLGLRAPLSFSYTYEITSVDAGDVYFCVNHGVCDLPTIEAVRGRHAMSPIAVSFFSDQADDPLAPTTGHRFRLDLEHASSLSLSQYRYNRVSGEATYYYPLDVYRQRVAAGRIRAGWVRPLFSTADAVGIGSAEEAALLHPRKRFYSGGSQSVRGYGENQLGPRILTVPTEELIEGGCSADQIEQRTCDPGVAPISAFVPQPLGGTAVLEGSVEYRFGLFGAFQGAAFVDGAVVGEGIGGLFRGGILAVTPGFGARFRSPVGPIRIDVGIRPSITERLPVLTEIEDEAGLRNLVRLNQRRRYNPVEAAGNGFVQEVLSRIALHLSIGEAY
ncbi:MAG: BamA/OMP85 family outer membrane protein [Bacteroidota bacterium]